ncbi:glycoside hydrolase family 16 protein [Sclerotinia borealis F-4128]|uniref:endo-1,3(4)-beta-glucanase n=1 Tax=Sclerotinia borealis (strain F-4128) TaxID=1432307 RepID=W9CHC6_SCLBF|nr:glycoside hydrolase family 16 protein [Sclerotinia borealis F-4128]
MATSSLFLRCLTIFTFITKITALTGYQLEENYSGNSFFDAFNFFPSPDPTHGFVTYVSESAASQQGLISTRSDGAYMGVDSKTVLSPGGAGRNSVRIESKKSWTHGLFVADLSHMPGGACGSWPAMWTVGNNWPYNGEIDIIEGVNSQNHNVMSLHTGPTCSIAGSGQTGTLQSANCNNFAGAVGVGCGISDPRTNSYGTSFNLNNGGIYAMEWTSSHIRVYFFPPGSAPSDINGPNPDPSKWGAPVSNFEGDCDIDSHFRENRLIFDTTFCGDWGSAIWSSDATCARKAATCTDYVARNPGAFTEQYWLVKSISIYQVGDIARPAPPLNTPTAAPVPVPAPASSAPVVAAPSPISAPPSQDPAAPGLIPTSPINDPIAQAPSQSNDNPLAGLNPIFDQIPNLIGEQGTCHPPPRPEPTYDPSYPHCGTGGKYPLTPAFTCTGTGNNILPSPPTLTLPSVIPAGQLLGIGSGGIPICDEDTYTNTDLETQISAAQNELEIAAQQGIGKNIQAAAWKNSESIISAPLETPGATHAIVAKPFYPDEGGADGNGNETAGSVASPTPGVGTATGALVFEGGARRLISGKNWGWGVLVLFGAWAFM